MREKSAFTIAGSLFLGLAMPLYLVVVPPMDYYHLMLHFLTHLLDFPGKT